MMLAASREIGVVTSLAAEDAVRLVGLGKLETLGQVETYIQSAVERWLNRYGPELGAKLASIAEPAAKKAVEIIGPVVEQKLKEYVPTFAMVTGMLLGGAILLGVMISRSGAPRRNPHYMGYVA